MQIEVFCLGRWGSETLNFRGHGVVLFFFENAMQLSHVTCVSLGIKI